MLLKMYDIPPTYFKLKKKRHSEGYCFTSDSVINLS